MGFSPQVGMGSWQIADRLGKPDIIGELAGSEGRYFLTDCRPATKWRVDTVKYYYVESGYVIGFRGNRVTDIEINKEECDRLFYKLLNGGR